MFDIGWSELVLIAIVALIVVGPKELPGLFRTVGVFMGKARGMAREFQRSMEQAADESGLGEASKSLQALNRLNLNSATSSARKYAENVMTEKPKPAAASTVAEAKPPSDEPAAAPSAAGPAVEPESADAPAVEPASSEAASDASKP
jgi:sec-independent protein translocase protein TatB